MKMIKKIFCVAMIGFIAHSAYGENAEYGPESVNKATFMRLGGLYSVPSKVFKAKCNSAFGIDFGVGHVFNPHLRAELTFSYRRAQSNKTDQQHVKAKVGSKTLMLNLSLSPKTFSDFTPYVNIGFGGGINRLHKVKGYPSGATIPDTYRQSITWQLGFGLYYTPCPDVGVDLQYRYIDLGKVSPAKYQIDQNGNVKKIPTIKASKLNAHEISLGLVFFLL